MTKPKRFKCAGCRVSLSIRLAHRLVTVPDVLVCRSCELDALCGLLAIAARQLRLPGVP